MTNETTTTPARPQFLTILCILTFIGCALGLYNGISTVMSADTAAAAMGAGKSAMSDAMDKMEKASDTSMAGLSAETQQKLNDATKKIGDKLMGSVSAGTFKTYGFIVIICSLLCALGAWWMWGLQKKGFYTYVIGELGGIIAPFATVGGLVGGIAGTAALIFGIIFIILYALNLKHLK